MSQTPPPLKLHDFQLSGHCHRVRLMLSLLKLPHQVVPVDLPGGEHKREPFLSMNPFGQVPVLQDFKHTLADSNAILVYLAQSYGPATWMPSDPIRAAAVQRWLSVAAGDMARGLAAARNSVLFGMECDMADATRRGHALLTVMDRELSTKPFLAGESPTVADVACYSYTAHAPDGRIALDAYRNVKAWLARVEALPGFVAMPRH